MHLKHNKIIETTIIYAIKIKVALNKQIGFYNLFNLLFGLYKL